MIPFKESVKQHLNLVLNCFLCNGAVPPTVDFTSQEFESFTSISVPFKISLTRTVKGGRIYIMESRFKITILEGDKVSF